LEKELAIWPQLIGFLPGHQKREAIEVIPAKVRALVPAMQGDATIKSATTTPIYLESVTADTTIFCFMSLGKNKAKIYMQEEPDVTFDDAAGVDEAEQELVEVVEFLRDPERFTELGGKLPKVDPDLDIEKIASMTPGMVGADLADLVNEAALLAVRRKKRQVGIVEFEEAVERVVAGLEKKNRLINPREREIVAIHEMGQAVVALSIPGADPVQKISIIP
jgi:ATP-dependent Zn protease